MEKLESLLPVFILFLSTVFVSPASAANKLQVHLINVGQGDSIYIKTRKGDDIIYNEGNRDGSDVATGSKRYGVKARLSCLGRLIARRFFCIHFGSRRIAFFYYNRRK